MKGFFYRRCQIQNLLLISGTIACVLSRLVSLDTLATFLHTASVVCFVIGGIIYVYLFWSMHRFSCVKLRTVLLAAVLYTVTVLSIFLWDLIFFHILFLCTIILRKITGIRTLEREMMPFCYRLDLELFLIGKQSQDLDKCDETDGDAQ